MRAFDDIICLQRVAAVAHLEAWGVVLRGNDITAFKHLLLILKVSTPGGSPRTGVRCVGSKD